MIEYAFKTVCRYDDSEGPTKAPGEYYKLPLSSILNIIF